MITCHQCGRTYSPAGGGHCMECHRTFRVDSAFDAHRVGAFTARRCLTDAEMSERGWRVTPRGLTPHPERQGPW